MAYLLGVPDRPVISVPVLVPPAPVAPPPSAPVPEAPKAAIRVEERAEALPVPVVTDVTPKAVVPHLPRVPLAIRIDRGLKPVWDQGPLVLVAGAAIPSLVCCLGGAIATLTGAPASPWLSLISLLSPVGTVMTPAAMIGVRVLADAQRLKLRREGRTDV